MKLRRLGTMTLALSFLMLAGACGDDHGDEHGGLSVAEEACEHTKKGPFEAVNATADAASAPSATFAHTAVNITLTEDADNAGSYIGYVTYAADEAAEFAFFLSADIPFAIFDASDTEVAVEESADVAECTEVAKQHAADLEVGTYTLWFGPTTETTVSLVVEEASHEAHEGEDH